MKEFGNINTKLPYKESESYVDALVQRSVETARLKDRAERKINRNLVYTLVGVAACKLAEARPWG